MHVIAYVTGPAGNEMVWMQAPDVFARTVMHHGCTAQLSRMKMSAVGNAPWSKHRTGGRMVARTWALLVVDLAGCYIGGPHLAQDWRTISAVPREQLHSQQVVTPDA